MILEIVRLRDEVAMLQQEARIRKNLCDGFASEAAEERAAVVAHLRECSRDPEATFAEAALLNQQADSIERGEHRREEE
jgi:hypothetical protein